MELEDKHLKAILQCKSLAKHIKDGVRDKALVCKPIEEISDTEFVELFDCVNEVWMNYSPIVQEHHGHCGSNDGGDNDDDDWFPIGIRGVPGAYWVYAQEFDNSGPFSTIAEARKELNRCYWEYL